jgi:hypothetical protein
MLLDAPNGEQGNQTPTWGIFLLKVELGSISESLIPDLVPQSRAPNKLATNLKEEFRYSAASARIAQGSYHERIIDKVGVSTAQRFQNTLRLKRSIAF